MILLDGKWYPEPLKSELDFDYAADEDPSDPQSDEAGEATTLSRPVKRIRQKTFPADSTSQQMRPQKSEVRRSDPAPIHETASQQTGSQKSEVSRTNPAPIHQAAPLPPHLQSLSGLLPTYNKRKKEGSLQLPQECWKVHLPLPSCFVEPDGAPEGRGMEPSPSWNEPPASILEPNIVASRL